MTRPLPASSPGPAEHGGSSMREAAALLLLVRSGRLDSGRYAALVEECSSAVAVLERERLGAAAQTSFFADPERDLEADLARAEAEIAAWRARGLRLVTVLDDGYPDNLRAAHDRPSLLFVAGQIKRGDHRAVAVIGSRAASEAGLRAAGELAEQLVEGRFTVVSGLAAGIDTAAHTAALRRGGRTLAVIGTGLRRCYPRSNVALQRRIAAQCAVVSQFPPDTAPAAQNFPLRNAVMSGLSLASVVVEATYTSGARVQARCALAQGRPVFILRSLLSQRWARDLAERPGLHVAATPADITAAVERLTSTQALVA